MREGRELGELTKDKWCHQRGGEILSTLFLSLGVRPFLLLAVNAERKKVHW